MIPKLQTIKKVLSQLDLNIENTAMNIQKDSSISTSNIYPIIDYLVLKGFAVKKEKKLVKKGYKIYKFQCTAHNIKGFFVYLTPKGQELKELLNRLEELSV